MQQKNVPLKGLKLRRDRPGLKTSDLDPVIYEAIDLDALNYGDVYLDSENYEEIDLDLYNVYIRRKP